MDATIQQINLIKVIEQLGDGFAARVTSNDQDDLFVAENFAELKQNKMFSAMVPVELGGGGASHSQMCEAVRKIATYCGSTDRKSVV